MAVYVTDFGSSRNLEGTDLLGFVDLGNLGEESRPSLGLAIKRMEFSWE